MKILFSGGGTLGPVTPLLAVHQEILNRKIQAEFLWVGTKAGPEYELITNYKIPFISISSGKLRRYFSIQNFIDPFRILMGMFQSMSIIRKFKPDVIATAGGYVAVPVAWAAKLLKVPCTIHEQDASVGMANKIVARKIYGVYFSQK